MDSAKFRGFGFGYVFFLAEPKSLAEPAVWNFQGIKGKARLEISIFMAVVNLPPDHVQNHYLLVG